MKHTESGQEVNPSKYLSPKQLASRWAMSPSAVYRLAERNGLANLRVGLAIRFPIDAIEAFEAAQTGGAV
jgi:excisionase family DNA binding protein